MPNLPYRILQDELDLAIDTMNQYNIQFGKIVPVYYYTNILEEDKFAPGAVLSDLIKKGAIKRVMWSLSQWRDKWAIQIYDNLPYMKDNANKIQFPNSPLEPEFYETNPDPNLECPF